MAGSDPTQSEEKLDLKEKIRRLIFHSDNHGEKLFDIVLIFLIVLSVHVVMMESVPAIRARHEAMLYALEWFFTGLFTIEYIIRLYVSLNTLRYMRSFFGVVDLLSILPTYISLFLPGAQYLMLLRALRVLRVFRVLKMAQYIGEANLLIRAMRASSRKIIVFIFSVVTLVTILGSIMYLIEGPEHGFTSIPKSVYWAIVTLTTVGYGDVAPETALGQGVAAFVMIIGYGIIAVPTGIVTAEITLASREARAQVTCSDCGAKSHDLSASYCARCGNRLGVLK